mmetsp:Transcript_30280/g.54216  ORF Transcript_30280/g.54216 Transcript_30280/m.54216 type:complete len:190 (-) Transcript_30280:323-892(-)
MLRDAAERHLDLWSGELEGELPSGYPPAGGDSGLERLRIRNLGLMAEELSEVIVKDRVLSFFEKELPHVAQQLFGEQTGLREKNFSYSPGEPAVNKYTSGGEFKVHQDYFTITINILLSEPDAFVGGGTAFWPQHRAKDGKDEHYSVEDAVLLRPRQGTGVIFNGEVQHSGRAVQAGVRHLYVASFNLG